MREANALDHEMLLGIEELLQLPRLHGLLIETGEHLDIRAYLGNRVLDRIQSSPLISIASIPGHALGGVARLTGVGRAKELCMTGRRITAREAEAIGLVQQAVEPGQLGRKTAEFAGSLAGKSREALRGIKVLADSPAPGAAAHRFDALLNAALLNNERGREAIANFLSRFLSRKNSS